MVKIEDIIEIRKAEVFDRGYEIVFLGDHGNQLVTQNECDDHASDWNDDCL